MEFLFVVSFLEACFEFLSLGRQIPQLTCNLQQKWKKCKKKCENCGKKCLIFVPGGLGQVASHFSDLEGPVTSDPPPGGSAKAKIRPKIKATFWAQISCIAFCGKNMQFLGQKCTFFFGKMVFSTISDA